MFNGKKAMKAQKALVKVECVMKLIKFSIFPKLPIFIVLKAMQGSIKRKLQRTDGS